MVDRRSGVDDAYTVLASVYDRLIDYDHEAWATYLGELWRKLGAADPQSILDVGCGTGSVTIALTLAGYEVHGVDASRWMLAEAAHKAQVRGLCIPWYHQTVQALDLENQYDMVISTCDCLNYVLTEQELIQAFARIHSHCRQGGLFLFDLNSEMKLREIYGDHSYAELQSDLAYFWDNRFDEETTTCHMELTFFTQMEQGTYMRQKECHVEKLWRPDKVVDVLGMTGWVLRGYFAFPTWEEPNEHTERWQFVAERA